MAAGAYRCFRGRRRHGWRRRSLQGCIHGVPGSVDTHPPRFRAALTTACAIAIRNVPPAPRIYWRKKMGEMVRLRARDGHELDAYVAEPKEKAKGGVVIVQEIFGVTEHIERVADQYAAEGFMTIAPAMFDRIERDITLP